MDRLLIPILIAAGGTLLPGCGRSANPAGPAPAPPAAPREPEEPMRTIDRDTPHEWPPLRLDSSGEVRTIVLEGPDPGWTLVFDGTEEIDGEAWAFATIRRGEPGMMQPQVITERRAETGVPSDEPLNLAARIAEHDGSGAGPYHPVSPRE